MQARRQSCQSRGSDQPCGGSCGSILVENVHMQKDDEYGSRAEEEWAWTSVFVSFGAIFVARRMQIKTNVCTSCGIVSLGMYAIRPLQVSNQFVTTCFPRSLATLLAFPWKQPVQQVIILGEMDRQEG